jgi:hypothetical protein
MLIRNWDARATRIRAELQMWAYFMSNSSSRKSIAAAALEAQFDGPAAALGSLQLTAADPFRAIEK